MSQNEDVALVPFHGEGDVWNLGSNGDAFSLAWGGVYPSAAYLNIMTQRDEDELNDDPRLTAFFTNTYSDEDGNVLTSPLAYRNINDG